VTNALCCLCSVSYRGIGHDPAPLALKGRCCDACNEVVIEARINPAAIMEEIERVEDAMLRMALETPLRRLAIAAVCALRGPSLWAEKQ
jgi:hypothetical protein